MARKKTAVEKRDQTPLGKIEVLAEPLSAIYPAGRLLISSPREIQAVIQRIPAGRVLTNSDLRVHLAAEAGADYTCPMTTGIFIRIIAEAAQEEGLTNVPYWRVVKDDGKLNDKIPGGQPEQATRLQAEGVDITQRGKTHRVAHMLTYRWQPD